MTERNRRGERQRDGQIQREMPKRQKAKKK